MITDLPGVLLRELVQHRTDGAGRAALLGTCHALARAVVEHHTQRRDMQLTRRVLPGTKAAWPAPLRSLLCAAWAPHRLALTLTDPTPDPPLGSDAARHGRFALPRELLPLVTTLHVSRLEVSRQDLQALRAAERLTELHLDNCHLVDDAGPLGGLAAQAWQWWAAPAGQLAAGALPRLTTLRVVGRCPDWATEAALQLAPNAEVVEVRGGGCATTGALVTELEETSVLGLARVPPFALLGEMHTPPACARCAAQMMPLGRALLCTPRPGSPLHLPHLTRLRWIGQMTDQQFALLLQHPCLRRVAVRSLRLAQDHSTAECRWEELQVRCSAAIHRRLPSPPSAGQGPASACSRWSRPRPSPERLRREGAHAPVPTPLARHGRRRWASCAWACWRSCPWTAGCSAWWPTTSCR